MPVLYIGGPLAQLVEHLTLNQGVTGSIPVRLTTYARVAELADALDLGSSGVTPVGVQIPPLAPGALHPQRRLFTNNGSGILLNKKD